MKPITTTELKVTDFECAMCGKKRDFFTALGEGELCETCYNDFYLDCQSEIAAQD